MGVLTRMLLFFYLFWPPMSCRDTENLQWSLSVAVKDLLKPIFPCRNVNTSTVYRTSDLLHRCSLFCPGRNLDTGNRACLGAFIFIQLSACMVRSPRWQCFSWEHNLIGFISAGCFMNISARKISLRVCVFARCVRSIDQAEKLHIGFFTGVK